MKASPCPGPLTDPQCGSVECRRDPDAEEWDCDNCPHEEDGMWAWKRREGR